EPDSAGINALILISELAFERGDCKMAAEGYSDAVAQLRSPGHARRALEIALACEHLPAAWQAVTYWRSLAPTDLEAATLYAAVALKLHRLPRAREALATVIKKTNAEADREIIALTALLLQEATPA